MNRSEKVAHLKVLRSVACPTCRVPAGEPCVNRRGAQRFAAPVHQARITARRNEPR